MLRATLKGMLSRKVRLILSTLAVVLGVMFVSGAFVLTDTLNRSFHNLFTTIYDDIDIQVSKPTDAVGLTGQPVMANVPADQVPVVAEVPGVARAVGGVFVDGAKVVDKSGKVVPTTGAPRFGANWIDSELVSIRPGGRAPAADDEIMISANLAKTTGYAVGDTVEVLTTLDPAKRPYTLVGIVGYTGGRDSLAGETIVYFTEPVAQQRMLGETGVYSEISVDVEPGADLTTVRDAIAAVLGPEYAVRTGEELAAESANSIEDGLRFFTSFLLGFAGIALFVGIFIIINTFSITVAQRTRELALLRAIGAERGQVVRSVLVEALVVGLVASVVGLVLGLVVGSVLGMVLGNVLSGGTLELAGVALTPEAVISAFAVGIGVTLVAALLPALRAARIPPVAAMRESATPDRPLTALSVSGAVVLAIGAVVLGLGLAGRLGDGDGNLWGVLGGVLTCFVGVALLTPIISRPVVAALGRVLSWGAAGALGRRNSGRNPRRTAITAAALMVSVAIITGISVVFASIKASTEDVIDAGFDADLIISADPLTGGLAQIDPAALEAVRGLAGVEHVAGQSLDFARVNGSDTFVRAIDDMDAAVAMLRLRTVAGTLEPGEGEIVVDDRTARAIGVSVGDTVRIQLARTGEQTMRVAGIYERTPVAEWILVSVADAHKGFSAPAPVTAFVKLRPGANEQAVLDQVRAAIADSPEVNVLTIDQYVAASAQIFDFILFFVQILLVLAMVIAVLGVINTLALSMIERTREVGLLRAVGMRRGQIMSMVTVESVVICVFGALLGIAVGAGLGVAAFQAFRDSGLTSLAFPWPLMVFYVAAAIVVGVVAAFIPALISARQNVLRAIAYE
ncbi:MAG: ABC transporter permease [Micromonosporaceae bacterium]|nr:ABC transporter permease [Micromonosporaceae bacterium]